MASEDNDNAHDGEEWRAICDKNKELVIEINRLRRKIQNIMTCHHLLVEKNNDKSRLIRFLCQHIHSSEGSHDYMIEESDSD